MQSPICAILTTGTGDVGDSSFTTGSCVDCGSGISGEVVVDGRVVGMNGFEGPDVDAYAFSSGRI